MYMAAAFAFDRHRSRGWYTWCVENAVASGYGLDRSIWMALRFEPVGEHSQGWLERLEQEMRRPTMVAKGRRPDAKWLVDALRLEPRSAVASDRCDARWLRDALRPSELPPRRMAAADRDTPVERRREPVSS